jgi:PilZ domain
VGCAGPQQISADGCLIELLKPQLLSQSTITELIFTVNDLPVRMSAQVRAIRSDTTIGFQFSLLSDGVRRRLACFLEQMI